jgi:hypothetical protein
LPRLALVVRQRGRFPLRMKCETTRRNLSVCTQGRAVGSSRSPSGLLPRADGRRAKRDRAPPNPRLRMPLKLLRWVISLAALAVAAAVTGCVHVEKPPPVHAPQIEKPPPLPPPSSVAGLSHRRTSTGVSLLSAARRSRASKSGNRPSARKARKQLQSKTRKGPRHEVGSHD